MNKTIKKKWLEALRSGKYRKAKEQLKKQGRFCCLGVLCDIYRNETGKGKWVENEFVIDGYAESEILPDPVLKWAGIKDKKLSVTIHGFKEIDLTAFNDGDEDLRIKPHTFKKIADLIEEKL